ncbi:hypothetical protein SKAU_G00374740 [Synaphobranchus kaupii]|uniref:Uncharacterized protein n=1 Tax=Synaphobranchus kaupii TaxID=118154 RepID=A0A9Q1EGR2_SYNKA|nr:hypothetical protein SKAU_G00374740 [Synaphobranchus kaupii]
MGGGEVFVQRGLPLSSGVGALGCVPKARRGNVGLYSPPQPKAENNSWLREVEPTVRPKEEHHNLTAFCSTQTNWFRPERSLKLTPS